MFWYYSSIVYVKDKKDIDKGTNHIEMLIEENIVNKDD
jgi:hypothetical protein